jgi:hypothetical protein
VYDAPLGRDPLLRGHALECALHVVLLSATRQQRLAFQHGSHVEVGQRDKGRRIVCISEENTKDSQKRKTKKNKTKNKKRYPQAAHQALGSIR